jgi:hypothetical protein
MKIITRIELQDVGRTASLFLRLTGIKSRRRMGITVDLLGWIDGKEEMNTLGEVFEPVEFPVNFEAGCECRYPSANPSFLTPAKMNSFAP